ncbi:L-dopachrome isomerase [Entamoeba marina]
MPFALLTIAADISIEKQKKIVVEAMNVLSKGTGNPVSYCSAQVVQSVGGFSGKETQCAFVDVRTFGGFNGKQSNLSSLFCKMLNEETGINPSNIFLNFTDLKSSNWGHNGYTY